MKFIEKLKQVFNTKNHKHEIIYEKGFGYRCKWCDKPKLQCDKENRKTGNQSFFNMYR